MAEFDTKSARAMAETSTADHAWVWADLMAEACDEIDRLRAAEDKLTATTHGLKMEIIRLDAELYAARAIIEAARLVVRRYAALPDDAPNCGVGHLEIRLAAYDKTQEKT